MWTFNYFSEIYDQKFRLGIFPLGVYLPTMLCLGEKSQVQKPRSCFSVLFLSFLNDVPSGRHTTRNTRFTSAQGTRWTSAPTVNNRTKGESYRWHGCEGKMKTPLLTFCTSQDGDRSSKTTLRTFPSQSKKSCTFARTYSSARATAERPSTVECSGFDFRLCAVISDFYEVISAFCGC